MSLRVELCSFLRKHITDYDPAKGIELDAGPGLTVEEVIKQVDIPSEEVKIITVNRTVVKPDYLLRDGDKVGLFTALVGG